MKVAAPKNLEAHQSPQWNLTLTLSKTGYADKKLSRLLQRIVPHKDRYRKDTQIHNNTLKPERMTIAIWLTDSFGFEGILLIPRWIIFVSLAFQWESYKAPSPNQTCCYLLTYAAYDTTDLDWPWLTFKWKDVKPRILLQASIHLTVIVICTKTVVLAGAIIHYRYANWTKGR